MNSGQRASGAALSAGRIAALPRGRSARRAGSVGDLWPGLRARGSWLHAVIVGSAATLALGFVHPIAYHSPTLRATAEAMIVTFGLAAASLLGAQFEHSRRLRDLLLLGALLTLALMDLLYFALPAAFDVQSGGQFAAALLFGELFAAATFAVAASPLAERSIAGGRRPIAIVAALGVVAVALAELGGLLLRSQLVTPATHPVVGIASSMDHPLAVVLALGSAALFAYAAVAFARRAQSERNGLSALLAGAMILLAASRLCYLALPWLSPNWVSPREGLRFLAFALILAAAVGRELQSREGIARAAAIAERTRVARDLHDGLAQDLAFIAAHGARLAEEVGVEHPVAIAARRALALSRGAIVELSDWSMTPTEDALEAIALELRARFQISIAVYAHLDRDLSPDAREQIVRITQEAVANAARHGGAEHVIVSMTRNTSGVALRIRDDGCGILGPGGTGPVEGFGLHSMRERATALGGYLTVRQPDGGGSEVKLVLP